MKLCKQERRLLNFLRLNGEINPLQAWSVLGIYRLGDVVFRLRKKGLDITTDRVARLNSFGEKCSFANYVLEKNHGES